MKKLRIGLLGTGFMARTHSNAYRRVNNFFKLPYEPELRAVCARNPATLKAFADQWGYASVETDMRRMFERDDIDVIDICLPNNLHKPAVLAAAAAGKMVFTEKPLALNAKEGETMCKAVEKAGVANMVWYNYRRVPAVTLAKQLVEKGKLGKIFHYRANFLQDWTISADCPMGGNGTWRLDAKTAGSGVTGDLLAHCIDSAIWINGPIESVSAMTKTFVKERKNLDTGKKEEVKIDDACAFLANFANGSMAVFESTRYARGHKALYTFEINGEKASLAWDLENMHRLAYFDHGDESIVRGWRDVNISDGDQPYMDKWWVPGLQIGYEHSFVHQAADALKALAKGENPTPSFADALATTKVCDAVLKSAKTGRWVTCR